MECNNFELLTRESMFTLIEDTTTFYFNPFNFLSVKALHTP